MAEIDGRTLRDDTGRTFVAGTIEVVPPLWTVWQLFEAISRFLLSSKKPLESNFLLLLLCL